MPNYPYSIPKLSFIKIRLLGKIDHRDGFTLVTHYIY